MQGIMLKSKSERGVSMIMRRTFFLLMSIFLFLPGAVIAEKKPAIKKHYEESILKQTEKKLFSIEMMIPGKEFRPGENKAEFIIYDMAGNDVEDAEITVSPPAPDGEQGISGEPVVTEKGGGFYDVNNIIPDVKGSWELRVTIKKFGAEDTAVFAFPGEKDIAGEETAVAAVGQKTKVPEGENSTLSSAVPDEKVREGKNNAVPAGRYDTYRAILKPLPAIPPIPSDNRMTPENIRLGKMLYWDRRASKTGATGCASCHNPSFYGAEPLQKSVSIGGEMHPRNAQTVLNTAFLRALFCAGESYNVEILPLKAVTSHRDVRDLPDEVIEALNRVPVYKKLSMEVFGEPLTEVIIGKSIAAFMSTLTTPNYPLARWLQGDESALTENQKSGMSLFVDKGCISCHQGPVFSDAMHDNQIKVSDKQDPGDTIPGLLLHKVIVPGAENDLGMANETHKEDDSYFFKVPSLLNVAKTPPYTHAGLIDNLHDMVGFMAHSMLNAELSSWEIDNIVAFLHSLTAELPADFLTVPLLPAGGQE